jgi:hypothetical protein
MDIQMRELSTTVLMLQKILKNKKPKIALAVH